MTSNKSVIEQHTSGVPKFVPLLIALLVISLFAIILLGRLAPRNPQVSSFDFVQATQVFTPGQPMTITLESIAVYIPKDSLNLPGTISVVSQEPNLFPAAAQPEWTHPHVIEVLFLNTQTTPVPNIVFSNPIHICFRITSEQWDDYVQRPDAYQVHYYAVENHPQTWQSLPMTAYADMTMLCGQTMHLSLFALAIRADSSIPVTGLTPTVAAILPVVQRTPREATAPAVTNPTSPAPAATEFLPTVPPQPTDTPASPPTVQPPTDPPPTDPPPTDPPPTDPPTEDPKRKQCHDGIDNDSDGFIDSDDPECRNPGDDDESG